MYEMQKAQEASFGDMDHRTRRMCSRINAASSRLFRGI
jgi:hypothetical protein